MQGKIMEGREERCRRANLLACPSLGRVVEQGGTEASGGSAGAARHRRGRLNQRRWEAFALRIGLLGFQRQSRPGPCHVGQDGTYPQVRGTVRHLPAFGGTLSALEGRNHRHSAERSRGKEPVHYTTTTTLSVARRSR